MTTKIVTVTVRKAVDRYHRVGTAIDVPHDKYHKSLIKAGWLELVEVVSEPTTIEPEAEQLELGEETEA